VPLLRAPVLTDCAANLLERVARRKALESVDRGDWKSAGGGKRERARFSRYAKVTFKKDRRLNIRLSSKDLEAIQKRALTEGLPYQTLIASLLHKYAAGRLKEI
jgi:predicted DNA binding CopG/RHH family protein